ncbi:MAG: DUF805 domain-containing protein [Rickettsiaceae bacterium]|nr:MAG: DUF805 domain-containing protein [Rickettsiaceae bacterium]
MRSFLQYFCAPLFPARIGRIQFLNAISANIVLLFIVITSLSYKIFFGKNIKFLTTLTTSNKIASLIILGVFIAILIVINKVILIVKRLHDTNLSSWWLLVFLLPIVNILFTIIIFFYSGSAQDNKFGPPPPKLTFINYFIAIISFFNVLLFYVMLVS